MTRRLLILSLAALAAVAAPPPKKPKLILGIVVDQFRADYLTRFRAEYTGGLARMLEKGAVFTDAHQDHFPTVTAIGHSTFMSGATPSISGIVGNEWYDRDLKKQITSVTDDKVAALGTTARRGASPRNLLVSTLGDQMKMSGGSTPKVIGISLKDRSAILPVGHMADAAYWFDSVSGNFISSTYYFNDLPGWVQDFNKQRFADKFLNAEWYPYSTNGNPPGGMKPFLKLAGKPDRAFYDSLARAPYGNDLVEAFAETALLAEKLGQRDATDLFTVSFSSNDYIGHALGPDAPEVQDVSVRTDRLLDKFFQFVDKQVGMDNVVVVFTADHGVAPLPEVMAKRKMPGGRMREETVHETVQTFLASKYGDGQWIVGKSGPAPYLNHDLIRQKGLNLWEVQETAAAAVRSMPNILRVYTQQQMQNGGLLDDMIDRRVRRGFNQKRSSDLFIVVHPYWLFEDRGTSHGTPYNYDTRVPIIFMGPGIKAGRYHQYIAVNDIAPTLAALLDIQPPSGATGRTLSEILE